MFPAAEGGGAECFTSPENHFFVVFWGTKTLFHALFRRQGFLSKIKLFCFQCCSCARRATGSSCAAAAAAAASLSCSYVRAPPRLQLSSRPRRGGGCLALLHGSTLFIQLFSSEAPVTYVMFCCAFTSLTF